ncbi:ABC transporter ATP-binding protein [Granulosicoccus antarcticus]|uniref:Aliphatic sulfonates import ATP-binding protein SsuB n=1 Tax=Granulosicoccus antarcticus IMCC3135 TaxID=1192854 RepID=A0A2Z2NGP0_9GAMM|nr:ATP-binding cassette domain-containing protein [Granulosicoccus antarcticus]ASJ70233.1 Aliphatic sulfonates import ATP-binding protein SsuB [Granulosicoccus antarcticus IMCC3135]
MPIDGVVPVSESAMESDLMTEQALRVCVQGRRFALAGGDTLHAVGALDFSLPANSFTCIVGPSGCGKTTTLRMILGLDKQYDGSIHLPGNGPIAAVFQEPRLLPWRTVEQNIRLVLPESRQNDSLDELLVNLGLEDLRGFYPNQLSLGLARRVALARAFVLRPQLLVLDEPFVSLDEPTAVRLRTLLLDLWQLRPTTILMVTHNAEEAASLADRILVFSKRPAQILRSIDIDTPRQQRDRPVIDSIVSRLGD